MKTLKQINPIVSSTIFSKVQESAYLQQMLNTEGYSSQRAVCEWFHYCKIKTHGKLPSVRNMRLDLGIDAITKLISIDQQDINDIILVLDYALTDKFWKENLLTVGQLRAKNPTDKIMRYERMLVKVQSTEGSKNDTRKFDTTLNLL